jgi:hypothetical protein
MPMMKVLKVDSAVLIMKADSVGALPPSPLRLNEPRVIRCWFFFVLCFCLGLGDIIGCDLIFAEKWVLSEKWVLRVRPLPWQARVVGAFGCTPLFMALI